MRPLWKGAISFGLVNIPVGLYSATKSTEKVKFNLLRDSDHSPIRYKRIAETDGTEVPWEHIVKGYEYEKGQFVVLTDEDFERVEIKSSQIIDIKEFVDLKDIDPRFFDEPYFLAPEKSGAKAYSLLREALERSGKVGISKVVIRPPREHLAAVKPLDGGLTLELMHFADELRDLSELDIPKPAIGPKELNMAKSLVDSMSDHWAPERFHDEYREALMKLIEQKVKSAGKPVSAPRIRKPAASKTIDLVSILQDSINQIQKGHSKKPPRARKAKAA